MRKHRSSVSDKRTKKTFVFLDQLLEIMSDDVRSGASIRRIRQMKDKSLKQQIAVTDRASFQNCTLSRFRPARPSTPSLGTAPNDHDLHHNHLEASRHIFSSQCNIQQASTPKGSCKPFFLIKIISCLAASRPSAAQLRPKAPAEARRRKRRCGRERKPIFTVCEANGGAKRDRTADPLLAKQVLSQLSYSPNSCPDQTTMLMVGPGRLELPTPRLSSVCSNQLSYGPTLPNT